jgi:hypothetical protein
MRTLVQKQRPFWERVTDRLSGGRHYNVAGSINFVFDDHTVEPNLEQLAKAICTVDLEFPWRDDLDPGRDHAGLGMLLIPNVIVHNWSTPEKVCWYSLAHLRLRMPQAYAYEQYLAKLAKELSKRHIPNVTEVRSVIEMTGATYFKVA